MAQVQKIWHSRRMKTLLVILASVALLLVLWGGAWSLVRNCAYYQVRFTLQPLQVSETRMPVPSCMRMLQRNPSAYSDVLMNLHVLRSEPELAYPYAVQAAGSGRSLSRTTWSRIARIAELQNDWELAALAWQKAGLPPEFEDFSTQTGNLLLDDFSDLSNWAKDPYWLSVDHEQTKPTDQGYSIHFSNQTGKRDKLSYVRTFKALPMGDHPCLRLNLQLGPGSMLTVDVLSDGEIQRPLSYLVGEGEKLELAFPLSGEVLEKIYLGFSEPENFSDQPPSYHIILESLELIHTSNCGHP